MKNSGKKAVRRIISLVLCFILIASSSATAFASSLISAETTAKSVEIAHRIESEGIVLLKNENDTLPLKTKKSMFSVQHRAPLHLQVQQVQVPSVHQMQSAFMMRYQMRV